MVRLSFLYNKAMEYAIQILLPIGLGLLLGQWLTTHYGVSALWTVIFAIIGMFLGMGMLYKRAVEDQLRAKRHRNNRTEQSPEPSTDNDPAS